MIQIDLHSHVLPGLDDGARDTDEAVAMLKVASADGTQVIIATPHDASTNMGMVLEGVAALNEAAARAGLSITVLPGSEIRLTANLVDRFRSQTLITLNDTSYILLELSEAAGWPPFLRSAIYDLQLAGLQPILAHAERYLGVQHQPDILSDLIATGVLIQINADSLLDRSGSARQRTAELLVRTHVAHIIASDAHGPYARPPLLAAAYERARELTTSDHASWIQASSVAIVHGQPITIPDIDRDRLLDRRRQLGSIRRWFTRARTAHR